MKKHGNIAIMIMAAGGSTRMGSLKPLLPWKDSNLLLHTIKTVKSVQKDRIYVVLGNQSEKIREATALDHKEITIIENPTWKNGLGNSIATGIRHILSQDSPSAGVLIGLADQPLLKREHFQKMIATFVDSENMIVATKYENRAGVPAIFNGSMLSKLAILDKDYGAKELLRTYEKSIFTVDAGNQIIDLDTPEEYTQLYKQHH